MQIDLWLDIFWDLGSKLGSLFVFAYLVTRLKAFRQIVTKKQLRLKDRLLLAVIFGIFGIIGTYFSFEYNGALINTRLIGVASGGLIGGPLVGLLSGVIAGIHRFLISSGNVTSTACSISTVFEGMMAGFMGLYIKDKVRIWPFAFLTGIIGESMRKIALLIMIKPFAMALDLVLDIWLPMVLMNSIGLALFFLIIQNILNDHERLQASAAHLALKIVDEALPYIRSGFGTKTFNEITEIIYKRTDFAAITLTDREKILSHNGAGTKRHDVGKPIVTYLTESVLNAQKPKVMDKCLENDCEYLNSCPLKSSLTLPLSDGEMVVGTLKLYKNTEASITELDVELGEGLAKLISTEIKISKIERKDKLLKEAEYKALQSQINPHFLFNSLTVIASVCRVEPDKARELILNLSQHFRKNINTKNKMVTIQEEIEHVKAYVAIEKARLNEDLEIEYRIEDQLSFDIPPLTLQPMVENAIKHGIYPKKGGGRIIFSIHKQQNQFIIVIKDNGVGMPETFLEAYQRGVIEKTDSYGLNNVIERLKSSFGERFNLKIDSMPNEGTTIEFRVDEEYYA